MSPRLALLDAIDQAHADTQLSCYSALATGRLPAQLGQNRTHLILRKTRIARSLAPASVSGPPPRLGNASNATMPLPSAVRRTSTALPPARCRVYNPVVMPVNTARLDRIVLALGPVNVFALRNRSKMIRSDASTIAADVIEAVGIMIAMHPDPEDAVCSARFAIERKRAISVRESTADPNPAVALHIDLAKESDPVRILWLRNCNWFRHGAIVSRPHAKL